MQRRRQKKQAGPDMLIEEAIGEHGHQQEMAIEKKNVRNDIAAMILLIQLFQCQEQVLIFLP